MLWLRNLRLVGFTLLVLLGWSAAPGAFGFLPHPRPAQYSNSRLMTTPERDTKLWSNDTERMQIVRGIQDAFYSDHKTSLPKFQHPTNNTLTLPIWRVQWTELPSRTNVLRIHEPLYTNMMEELLRTTHDHYFGHVDISQTQYGTLLRITDYRRLKDGSLLLLVQAIEKFQIQTILQEYPYEISNCTLLPDLEENESFQHAWEYWHPFEFEDTRLDYTDCLTGSDLARLLPYAGLNASRVPEASALPVINKRKDTVNSIDSTNHTAIAKSLPAEFLDMTTDQLEITLWETMNHVLVNFKTAISPILIGLLPRDVPWSEDFTLDDVANRLEQQTALQHKYIATPDHYPKARRQRLLSYHSAYLLEKSKSRTDVQDLRRILLSIRSTKTRLAYVLWWFRMEYDSFQ